jgi:hypothetical protein
MLSLLLTITAGSFTSSAQQPADKGAKAQKPFAPPRARSKEFIDKLPPGIKEGASPEARAAWEKLTPEQREMVKERVHKAIEEAKAQAAEKRAEKVSRKTWKDIIKGKKDGTEVETTTFFTDKEGQFQQFKSLEREAVAPSSADSTAMAARARAGRLASANASAPNFYALAKDSSGKADNREQMSFAHPRMMPQQYSISPKTVDQFVADFYQAAFNRQPRPDESAQWSNSLAQAQAQSQADLIAAGQNMGRTLFQSQEYVNRYRSDRDYVYDLYKAFLQREPDQGGWDFWTGGVGRDGRAAVLEAFVVCDEYRNDLTLVYNAASFDADADQLPDHFEDRVADAFTPVYHISAYEVDQFATWMTAPGSNTQTLLQRLGQTPLSHYRVQPLGFDYDVNGQLMSVLRIDYLTLIDHDSGLVTGGACDYYPGLNSLQGMQAHDIDNERSAVLVAAPVWGYYYNQDPMAYSAYSYFTTAHEDTPVDKTRHYDYPYNPVPAGWHINLALSLYKHGTYAFNPDYMPILPDYVIYSALEGVEYFCNRMFMDGFGIEDILCLAAEYYLYGLFYDCAVERFFDQGGRFADRRINVGEPDHPINGADFIRDDTHKLYSRLVNLYPTF